MSKQPRPLFRRNSWDPILLVLTNTRSSYLSGCRRRWIYYVGFKIITTGGKGGGGVRLLKSAPQESCWLPFFVLGCTLRLAVVMLLYCSHWNVLLTLLVSVSVLLPLPFRFKYSTVYTPPTIVHTIAILPTVPALLFPIAGLWTRGLQALCHCLYL